LKPPPSCDSRRKKTSCSVSSAVTRSKSSARMIFLELAASAYAVLFEYLASLLDFSSTGV
jgi:hypothetical protein